MTIMYRRRALSLGTSALAMAVLSGCAWTKAIFSSTDYLGEAASAFTAGSVAVTALTTLVQTGVIAKAKAQSLDPYVKGTGAAFATLSNDVDSGAPLAQVMIDAATTALGLLQQNAAPVVAPITPAQMQHTLSVMRAHPKAFDWAAIISLVLGNLNPIISAGAAIASLIQTLIGEVRNIVAGSTTVAQVDAAYAGWVAALNGWEAAIA